MFLACDGLASCPGCTLPSRRVRRDGRQPPRDPNEDQAGSPGGWRPSQPTPARAEYTLDSSPELQESEGS